MGERRVQQFTTESGDGKFTYRQTRTGGNLKTVTTQETHYGDQASEIQKQFTTLSIPKQEEKPKRGFLGGLFKKESSSTSAKEFDKQCLDAHNEYRKKHRVPALVLSKELCKYSQEWASKLAKEDSFQHRPKNQYGENIYMKWFSNPDMDIDGKNPVDDWYSEIKDHTYGREPATLKSGHFTQVVWEASKELGVGKGRTKTGKIIVVCNYSPAGNMMGQFTNNVHPPK